MSAAAARGVLQFHKRVKVAFRGRQVRQVDPLGAAARIDGTSARARAYRHVVDKVHGDILVALLDDEDGLGDITRLCCLIRGQLIDVDVDEEDVGQVIDLGLADVGLLEDVAVDADVPALVGPIAVRPGKQATVSMM